MLGLARVVLGGAGLVGGVGAVFSGDWRVVIAALLLGIMGMIPVAVLLAPGALILGAVASRLGDPHIPTASRPRVWVMALIGSSNAILVQCAWVLICGFVLANASNGQSPLWAIGLLWISASYGVWEWLAQKDLQAGDPTATVQVAFYGLGLVLLWAATVLVQGPFWFGLVLLLGAQMSAIPSLIELHRTEELLVASRSVDSDLGRGRGVDFP